MAFADRLKNATGAKNPGHGRFFSLPSHWKDTEPLKVFFVTEKKMYMHTCSGNCSLNCNGTKFTGWQWGKRSLERSNRCPYSTCYHHLLSAEEQSKSHNLSHNSTHIAVFFKCIYLLLFHWCHRLSFILQVSQSTTICINACSMESKHKEIGVQLQHYNLGITELWWDGSHGWSAAMQQ